MATFAAAFVLFGGVVLAMSLGVLLQGRRLKGSCGATGEDCACSPLAARNCRLREHRREGRAGAHHHAPSAQGEHHAPTTPN